MTFEFANYKDGNISVNHSLMFSVLKKHNYKQIAPFSFSVDSVKSDQVCNYRNNQESLRNIAIQWQQDFADLSYSYHELAIWSDFFTIYGKKYGLLREFHENAIC